MTNPTPKPAAPAPTAAPPAAPTQADAAAIAAAGGGAVDPNNQTPEQARAAADAAMANEASARNVALSDEERQQIANVVITALEARGAFESPPAAAPGTPPVGPADSAAPPEPVAPVEPPRKKTWAERFVGRT